MKNSLLKDFADDNTITKFEENQGTLDALAASQQNPV